MKSSKGNKTQKKGKINVSALKKKSLPTNITELVKKISKDEGILETYTQQDVKYIAYQVFGVELFIVNKLALTNFIGLNLPGILQFANNHNHSDFGWILKRLNPFNSHIFDHLTQYRSTPENSFIQPLIVASVVMIDIQLVKSLAYLERQTYRVGTWLNILFGYSYYAVDNTILNLNEFLFGPNKKTYAIQVFKTLYTMNKKHKVIFDLYEPVDWRNMGIVIPMYSVDLQNDPELKVLFKLEHSSEGLTMNEKSISDKTTSIKLQLSFYQCLSFLQHEMFDQFGLAYLMSIITLWNNNKTNIINKGSLQYYILFNNMIFDYNPVVENTDEYYEEEVRNEKKILEREEKRGNLLCSGPIFVGYLVSLDSNNNPIPYIYGTKFGIPISSAESLTSIPVFLKENGWFSTTIASFPSYSFVDCNPLKLRGATSCWELQMHYDEKGFPCGFYFLSLQNATYHDTYHYFSCTGPLTEIMVTTTADGDMKIVDKSEIQSKKRNIKKLKDEIEEIKENEENEEIKEKEEKEDDKEKTKAKTKKNKKRKGGKNKKYKEKHQNTYKMKM
jgi:hypothetical protein